jgi:hypothetical protein
MEPTDPISQYLCALRSVQPNVEMPPTLAIREGWPSLRRRLPVVGAEFRGMTRREEIHCVRLALAYAIAGGPQRDRREWGTFANALVGSGPYPPGLPVQRLSGHLSGSARTPIL